VRQFLQKPGGLSSASDKGMNQDNPLK